ncbi:hypothetical protein ACFQMA_08765 [Halosimplex aquaticum]|uniref:DUF8147 domain-containing protein n=1 Tax=Halosimplex aquaticum TaxID=3026162 RepID=A0ABD5Y2E8_9EURY|nr:hypothetical protein [Halosimplex aquaticum]
MYSLDRETLRNGTLAFIAGVVTFAVIAVALTAVLDPLIWPSLLVGLPVGFVAGTAAAVLTFAFLTRGPGRREYWRTVGLGTIIVVVVFGLLLGGLSVLGQDRVAASYDSTYEYEVAFDTNGTLEEPTIYVPAPVANDSTRLAEVFVEDVRYERYGPVGRDGGDGPAPVNFTYELVETDHGPMVAISADHIEVSRYYYRTVENETMGWTEPVSPDEYDPTDPSMGVSHDGSFAFTVRLTAEASVDTADPFGDEPLLSPQYDRTAVDCLDQRFDTQQCYAYDTRVFADYGADDGTTVTVSAGVFGRNEWFSGGWTGNEYRDRVAVELRGPQSGWHVAGGELETGTGRYRR